MIDTQRWEVHAPDEPEVAQAAQVIRDGGLVAFPTETVYGLGANAFDAVACQHIYDAKERDASDPCIVHLASADDIGRVASVGPARRAPVERLAAAFWPGPLSIILPRARAIPPVVTAGRRTVAVRVPQHPIALALITQAGVPIAAPSANRFGHTSPTTAQHVWDDLAGRIDVILDGGPATVGVESTVLDLTARVPTILRPGGVTQEMLEAVLGAIRMGTGSSSDQRRGAKAPGLALRHYAPRGELLLFVGAAAPVRMAMRQEALARIAAGQAVGLLVADEDLPHMAVNGLLIEAVGSEVDLPGVARRLFAALRHLEERGCDVILARGFERQGLGAAIHNRLIRAAAGHVVTCDPDGEQPLR